jgi:hypothetical protein
MKTDQIARTILTALVGATVGIPQAIASPSARPATGVPPRAASSEVIVLPQVIAPGVPARATNGATDDPNPCPFPIRTWAYVSHVPTALANGDIRIHVIKAISYQPSNGTRTVFETDNFNVLVHHSHPRSDWTITGRPGEWYLGTKRIWLEKGTFSATPNAHGGETINNPHPTGLSRQPSLCTALHR